jgi:hypothetical protein
LKNSIVFDGSIEFGNPDKVFDRRKARPESDFKSYELKNVLVGKSGRASR